MNVDQPHRLTVRSSATPYGNFRMTTRYLLHKMSVGCRYDGSAADPRCEGCKHRATDKEDTR